MRAILVLIALASFAGCVDHDGEWTSKCTDGGRSASLCRCLFKNLTAEEREKLGLPLQKFGGGWVAVSADGEAEYCEKCVRDLRKGM